jgi:hypothetical protein
MLTINTTAMMPVQAPSASPSVPYQLTYGIAILTVIHATRTPPQIIMHPLTVLNNPFVKVNSGTQGRHFTVVPRFTR